MRLPTNRFLIMLGSIQKVVDEVKLRGEMALTKNRDLKKFVIYLFLLFAVRYFSLYLNSELTILTHINSTGNFPLDSRVEILGMLFRSVAVIYSVLYLFIFNMILTYFKDR